MRFLLWLLVGTTCLMLASCPAKNDETGTNQPPTSNDNGDMDDWDE